MAWGIGMVALRLLLQIAPTSWIPMWADEPQLDISVSQPEWIRLVSPRYIALLGINLDWGGLAVYWLYGGRSGAGSRCRWVG